MVLAVELFRALLPHGIFQGVFPASLVCQDPGPFTAK
jgi:hypothetical protein